MAKKNIKFFILAFLLSFPFWGGVNFLFSGKEFSTAQLTSEAKPSEVEVKLYRPLNLTAKSAISLLVKKSGEEQILFVKNIDEKLPIASLTKLMTAEIVLENYDPENTAEIKGQGIFKAKDLLYSMLVESSNETANALAGIMGKEKFVELMNEKSKNLELANTHFANASGIDNPFGFSTARDLSKFSKYLFQNPLIWEILSKPEVDILTADGTFHHKATSTNELLGKIPSILGGKTGETPEALGCLLLVLKAPNGNGYLINIILGSENKFSEMERLVAWLNYAYRW